MYPACRLGEASRLGLPVVGLLSMLKKSFHSAKKFCLVLAADDDGDAVLVEVTVLISSERCAVMLSRTGMINGNFIN